MVINKKKLWLILAIYWIAAFLIGLALVIFLILLAFAAILALIKTLLKKKNGHYYFVKIKRAPILE